MLETVITWLTDVIFRLGYVGIALLMALESSLVPFPSEVVLPPAGYLAAEGRMSAPVAFGAGLLGSLIGALFNYFLAARLGGPLLHKYGKYMLIKINATKEPNTMMITGSNTVLNILDL